MYYVGNIHDNESQHKETKTMLVCSPTPSENSDQLKSPPNGTRTFAVHMKTFKSLGMQRVKNDGLDHIEGWMPKMIQVIGLHKWHIACFVTVRHGAI